MESANPETERKMEVIKMAHFSCGKVFDWLYQLHDALYDAEEEFRDGILHLLNPISDWVNLIIAGPTT